MNSESTYVELNQRKKKNPYKKEKLSDLLLLLF
jgi:hypothetical protein